MTELEKIELRSLLEKGRFLRMHHLENSMCADSLKETAIEFDLSHPKRIVWHTLHRTAIPRCENCEGPVEWTGDMPTPYRQTCSNRCRGIITASRQKIANMKRLGVEWHTQLPEVQQKAKQTNLKRYGVENPFQSMELREKAKKTSLEKYGFEHALQSPAIKDKVKQTNMTRYGVEWTLQNTHIREKAQSTMQELYGVTHALQHAEFLRKSQETCFTNYGVSVPAKSKHISDQIAQTNIAKYGSKSPTENEEVLRTRAKNNLTKYGVEHTTQINYSSEFLNLIADKNQFDKICQTITVREIADKFAVSTNTVYKYINDFNIQLPRTRTSNFESDIIKLIEENYNGKIIYSDRKIIGPKELDIYLPELNLAIECNGTYWHSENNGRGKNYHVGKTNDCKKKGIVLIHIWEHEWMTKRQIIESMILHRLGKSSKKLYARKTNIMAITSTIARQFYNEHHIQGGTSVLGKSYGLFNDDELVAAMSFGKSRFNKNYDWEIIRFAVKSGHSIVGAAGKLFSFFVKHHAPVNVVSYAARGHTTGGVYLMLGMTHIGTSSPAYYYTKNYIDFSNRQRFQKHKLENLLEYFDPSMTEWENMKMNGYDRIWDSGNDIFVWEDETQ